MQKTQTQTEESKIYLCEYEYEGETWGIQIHATCYADAVRRLRQISGGRVLGEVMHEIIIPIPGLGRLWGYWMALKRTIAALLRQVF